MKPNARQGILLSIVLATVFARPVSAPAEETLSLEQYLSQVRKQHQGLVASVEIREAARERSGEGSLLLSPTLVGNFLLGSDAKETASTAMYGDKTLARSYTLGIAQQTSFGLSAKLGYSLAYTNLQNAQVIVPNQFHEAKPTLELSQSLWRNWGGSETRASADLLQASALATSYAEDFKASLALAEAETAYWRLALARESVAVARETLESARKIRDWSAKRVNLNLADRADLLQAEAALEYRALGLQSALDEERAAARAFNTSRNLDAADVPESLVQVNAETILTLRAPDRAPLRADTAAAQEQSRAATASAQSAIERNKPQVEVFVSLALNGRDTESNPAVSESLTLAHPSNAIGLKLTAPLDFGTSSGVRDAYRREQLAAEKTLDRKLYEQEREWADLRSRLEEARKRLELARRLESVQKSKLQAERDRHGRGRSTTFQVLQFEQDFAESRLGRIRTEAEILGLVARMKTFSPNPAAPRAGGES